MYDYAVSHYKPYVKIALVSGGDDSIAMLEVLRRVGSVDYVVHVDTTCGIKKTTDFVIDYCDKNSLNLIITKSPEETFENIVLEYGFPGPAQHGRMYIRLKERALRVIQRRFQLENSFCRLKGSDSPHKYSNRNIPLQYHPEYPESEALVITKPERTIMYFTGARKDESVRRMGTVEDFKKEGNQVWVNIIADWTASDISHFRSKEKYGRNPVAEIIGRSGECNCGSFGDRQELQEMKIFFPDDENVKMIVRLESDCRKKGLKYCYYGHGQNNEIIGEENPENQPLCSSCVNKHLSKVQPMNSILLKTTSSGEEVVMYGFKDRFEAIKELCGLPKCRILFSGSKEGILSKEEEWIAGIVEEEYDRILYYKDYLDEELMDTLSFSALDSLESALSCLTHNNYILIIKTKR